MATKERIGKIELSISLSRYWDALLDTLPTIIRSPFELFMLSLRLLNFGLQLILVVILTLQTAHILNSQKRFINMKHLLIKWIILAIILLIVSRVKQHQSHDEIFGLLCHIAGLLAIYPSKFIKNLHLKYFSFSEKKKYEDSEDDPSNYQMTFFTRFLISITLFFLNTSRFIIAFVPPQHRKKIEEAMRGVNMIIVEEKYFWKIYQSNWGNNNTIPSQSMENQSASKAQLKNSAFLSKNESKQALRLSLIGKQSTRESIIRAKVGEYIQIVISALDSDRKFTFVRNLELVYNVESSELSILNEQDGKIKNYLLEQIQVIDEGIVKLICEDEQDPIYVKFKIKKQMDLFMNSIAATD